VTGESGGWAALRLLDQNRRRYGAQLAHVGMLLAVLAIAASSMFDSKHRFVLERNESKLIGQYVFTYTDWEQTRRPGANYAAEVATVRVAGPGGGVRVLRPELRSYDKWPRERNQEFALHSNLVRDLSVSLVNDWQNGTAVGLEVRIKPLVMWLWIGGVLVMLGGLLALTPPLSAVPQAADTPDSDGDRTEQLRSDAWRATLRRGRDADGPDEAGRGSKRDSSRLETSPSSSTTRDGKARRPDRQPVKT